MGPSASSLRTVKAVHPAASEDMGDLRTQRALPAGPLDRLDPFLLLNHHGPQVYPPQNEGLPFGPHPHRGFETVTFILEGALTHRDSAGHESTIGAGGVQWMTAGSGIEHSELSPPEFREKGGPLEVLQLWINLPARLKMTEPRYHGLPRTEVPALRVGAATVHLVSGTWDSRPGPVESLTGVQLLSLELEAGGHLVLPAPSARSVLLYVVSGDLRVSGRRAHAFHLVELQGDGEAVWLEATSPARVIFGHADPLREPVVARGPFVMNRPEEIVEAVRDYQAGRFR